MRCGTVLVSALIAASILSSVAHAQSNFVDAWTTLGASTGSPGTVQRAAMALLDHRAVMFGGYSGTALMSSTYLLNLRNVDGNYWTKLNPANPGARCSSAAAAIDGDFYIFGGCTAFDGSSCTAGAADLWRYSLSTFAWTEVDLSSGDEPSARAGATLVSYTDDEDDVYAILFGGETFSGSYDATPYIYYAADDAFRSVSPASSAPALAYHSAVMYNGLMYVWGGVTSTSTRNSDFWIFDPEAVSWTQETGATGDTPPGLWGAATAPMLNGFLIFGGYTGSIQSTVYYADLSSDPPVWTQLNDAPTDLALAPTVYEAGNVLVVGGSDGTTELSGVRRYYTRPRITAVTGTPTDGNDCGGDTITIDGEQFSGASTTCVILGGDSGEADAYLAGTLLSSTQIECTTLAHATGTFEVAAGNTAALLTDETANSYEYTFVEDETWANSSLPVEIPADAIAGTEAEFSIQSRTWCGSDRTVGGDSFAMALYEGAVEFTDVTIDIVDNSDGTYGVTFLTYVAGTYSIRLTLDSAPSSAPELVGGVEYTLVVNPDDANITASTVQEITYDGTVAGSYISPFRISSFDAFGNRLKKAGKFSAVATLGTTSVTAELTTGANGPTGTFMTTKSGTYTLNVYFGEGDEKQELANSPQYITIEPAVYKASNCRASGFALSTITVGVESEITITPRDQYSNYAPTTGLDFKVSLSGESESVTGSVVDTGAGDYRAQYTATKVGRYSVSVTLNSVHVVGSPFSLTAQLGNVVDISRTVASGDGIDPDGYHRAGTAEGFVIQVRDPYDNNVASGGLEFDVSSDCIKDVVVSDKKDGTYQVSYRLRHLYHFGENDIVVKSKGNGNSYEQIKDSPFTINVGYGVWFFVIVLLAVIIGSVIIAVVGTWAGRYIQKRARYNLLIRKPEEIFPPVGLNDDNIDGDFTTFDVNGAEDFQDMGVPLDVMMGGGDDVLYDFDDELAQFNDETHTSNLETL